MVGLSTIRFLALLLSTLSICAIDSVISQSGMSGSGPSEGTCEGIPFNGITCREQLLSLRDCIPANVRPSENVILVQSLEDRFGIGGFLGTTALLGASEECLNAASTWVCLITHGLCDTSGTLYEAPFSYCDQVLLKVCADEFQNIAETSPGLDISCPQLPSQANFSNSCFQSNDTSTEPTNTQKEPSLVRYAVVTVVILLILIALLTVSVTALVLFIRKRKTSRLLEINHRRMPKSMDNVNYVTDDGSNSHLNRYSNMQEMNSESVQVVSPFVVEQNTFSKIYGDNDDCNSYENSSENSYENEGSMSGSEPDLNQDGDELEGNYEKQEEFWVPSSEESELKKQLSMLNLPIISSENVELHEQIGSGQFGTVHRGVWHHSDSSDGPGEDEEVAVKSMKSGVTDKERLKFLQEAAIMGQFKNPQVLAILGIITKSDDLQIVMELMQNGDLRTHLQTLKPKPDEPVSAELGPTLLSYSRQVASGLIYFCVKNFIHRDLAARNILVSSCGMCKIADFGLSRDLHDEDFYTAHGGKIPVRWTAPEALSYRKYSPKSDMWSFGCVLYEIWSLGYKPFHDVPNVEVIRMLETGYRLPPPPGCPRRIYQLMMKTWHPDADSRPNAGAAVAALSHPDFLIFNWNPKDTANSSELARTLGSPLQEGYPLYKDLQQMYKRNKASQKRKSSKKLHHDVSS